MTISPLADFPAAIPKLAKWFFDEWHSFDGRSIDTISAQLSENLNRDSTPITFVAHRDSELLGSVSLDLSDLPPFDHLSPWLASLYVDAPFRGEGAARTLVRHLQHFVLARRLGPLYLWTPGSVRLYERCGWAAFASASYGSQPVTLMRFPHEPSA
jgi:GNAT superfamily N-acetyltransferase